MRIFHSLAEVPPDLGRTVVTIGNFDGVHCGHHAVLATVTDRARALEFVSVAVTFAPHPARVLHPERDLQLLTPLDEKLRLLEASGLDAVLLLEFTPEFAQTTAAEFARHVLRDTLHAAEVYEGEDFRFGRGAEGTLRSLRDMGGELGFTVQSFQPVMLGGKPISSSRVRSEISAGNISAARRLLGRPFSVRGATAAGRGVGRTQTVPTLNLSPYCELLPANGVYVTEVVLDGRLVRAVTNIGVRPTFGDLSLTVESFVLGEQLGEVPEGLPLEVTFLRRLRDERKFDSPEQLKQQIFGDVARAERFFALRERLQQKDASLTQA